MEKCPKCGSTEIEATTPRTVYKCGSSDYDQRPGTLKRTELCLAIEKHLEEQILILQRGVVN